MRDEVKVIARGAPVNIPCLSNARWQHLSRAQFANPWPARSATDSIGRRQSIDSLDDRDNGRTNRTYAADSVSFSSRVSEKACTRAVGGYKNSDDRKAATRSNFPSWFASSLVRAFRCVYFLALCYACNPRSSVVRELLLAGADMGATDNSGRTPGARYQPLSYLR